MLAAGARVSDGVSARASVRASVCDSDRGSVGVSGSARVSASVAVSDSVSGRSGRFGSGDGTLRRG